VGKGGNSRSERSRREFHPARVICGFGILENDSVRLLQYMHGKRPHLPERQECGHQL
jgi:hypothetical protein